MTQGSLCGCFGSAVGWTAGSVHLKEGHRGAGCLSQTGVKGPKPAGGGTRRLQHESPEAGPRPGWPPHPQMPPPGTQHAISSGLSVSPCDRELHRRGPCLSPSPVLSLRSAWRTCWGHHSYLWSVDSWCVERTGQLSGYSSGVGVGGGPGGALQGPGAREALWDDARKSWLREAGGSSWDRLRWGARRTLGGESVGLGDAGGGVWRSRGWLSASVIWEVGPQSSNPFCLFESEV